MTTQDKLQQLKEEISHEQKRLHFYLIQNKIDLDYKYNDNIYEALLANDFPADKEDEWTNLDYETAKRFFTKLFTKTMAYNSDLFDEETALSYWSCFTDLQNGITSFYTNIIDVEEFISNESHGSFPVTENTMDAALIFIDTEKVIGLIVYDED